jgi:hypothetical protein
MSGRVEEIHVEQAISDALYMVEHVEEIQKKEDSYHCA